MKWIKTAIGALIAISVIPLVVLSVINIKKSLETEEPEEITITFEMDYIQFVLERYIFNHTLPYYELNDYLEEGYTITNLYDHTHDINITITNWNFPYPDQFQIEMVDNNSLVYFFNPSYNMSLSFSYNSIYNANASDIVLMDIILTKNPEKNPEKNHKLVATLISFVPLIFVGGVVLYFYKWPKKD